MKGGIGLGAFKGSRNIGISAKMPKEIAQTVQKIMLRPAASAMIGASITAKTCSHIMSLPLQSEGNNYLAVLDKDLVRSIETF